MLLSAFASAYTFNGVSWSWQDHPVEDAWAIDVDSFPEYVGTDAELADAIDAAMAPWNELGLDASLSASGTASSTSLAADGHFYLRYEDLDDYSTGGTVAFAAAWTWDGSAAIDCDVTFLENNDYGDIYWDAAAEGPAEGYVDVQAVALHELGHCLGLDHSADSSAVMYAYYAGLRELAADDADGLAALYGTACVDGDGDGYSDCDGDCDDGNLAVHPGAAEVCDGADDNCDGVTDASERDIPVGEGSWDFNTGWTAVADVIYTEAPTLLRSWRQHVLVDADLRLVWSVHSAASPDGPWELERSEISYATGVEWESSPAVDLPLEAGRYYAIALGALGAGAESWYGDASLDTTGPITVVGASYSRALGDELGESDDTYLWEMELSVVDLADVDGDGQTTLCGDCADEDPAAWTGATEACDGSDNDCDGEVDEDWAVDGDGDGRYDCLDPCPADPADDADGDGACADEDPCPDDPEDRCDDSGADSAGDSRADSDPPDSADSAPTDGDSAGGRDSGPKEGAEPGGCGCDTPAGPAPTALLGALLLVKRRRHQGWS